MRIGNRITEEGIGMAGCLIATAPFPMRDRKLICVITSVLVAETGTCRAAAFTGECFGSVGTRRRRIIVHRGEGYADRRHRASA